MRVVTAVIATLIVLGLASCAGVPPQPPPERLQHFDAASDELLEATMASLAAQRFVIVYGDHALGELRARYAGRPEWQVEAHVRSLAGGGSELALAGRRGSAALAPQIFDRLILDIGERLGEGPLSPGGRFSQPVP
ncbi:hypothetical protein [Kushneria aurantia]|uniref:DUF4174 domain-containing protein n=1 Tax=Kushneria aurantia TaxID=504092 RepID=A0ABV6G7B0_9GAMM|nr:hypothetical protein [Kushneria aurantia]